MFILFGSEKQYERVGNVNVPCRECHRSPCTLFKGDDKFTLYTIPTFSIGTSYVLKCPHCLKTWEITPEMGQRLKQEAVPVPDRSPRARAAGPARPAGAPPSAPPDARSGPRPAPGPRSDPRSGPAAGSRPAPGPASNPGLDATLIRQPGAAHCRQCQKPLDPDARFCPGCGTPVRSLRKCLACGKMQSVGSHCAHCGGRLEA